MSQIAGAKRDYYHGIRMEPYDLIKEALIALGFATVVIALLAIVFSSPDPPAITLQGTARKQPVAFLQDALSQLDQTSDVATYGPPYNYHQGNAQWLGPISLQKIAGVWIPVNTQQDYVLGPLSREAQSDPALAQALHTFVTATPTQQRQWEQAYGTALGNASPGTAGQPRIRAGAYGPVGPMMRALLVMGRTGALDSEVLAPGQFYGTNYTAPLLFLGKPILSQRAQREHLADYQWGMMNEAGSWPGQAWLWLYTFWYQIEPIASSANADAWVLVLMGALSGVLIALPWIPWLNRLPRYLGVHRLIWRDYYREQRAAILRDEGGQPS